MTGRRLSGTARLALRKTLDADLQLIARARIRELRALWSERLGETPPALRSPEIARRLLGHRLQERALGGLLGPAKRKLGEIEARLTGAKRPPPAPLIRLTPGIMLSRDWKGVRHQVRVVQGGYSYADQPYRSLSEIARAITGTRWNGPLFFGLRKRAKEAA
jgi:hypothetical protein